ncbi:hypothetical protein [Streptomyces graminilatus]|uniref:hypothetical protein n=1 Tax=Streptomyces graminilatus TaxID=1464070 RepID=UPI0006E2661A|nr:hypothetical protein [Streptomyces graminilatus]
MPTPDADPVLAEEQILTALRSGIRAIKENAGACTPDEIAQHLIRQLDGGLLHGARHSTAASAQATTVDVGALVQAAYDVDTTIAGRTAQVHLTPGLADSGVSRGEHLDVRARVRLTYRVDLEFSCAFVSTNDGASWGLAFTEADRSWLASAETMAEPVGHSVTALLNDPAHRPGMEPVVTAARHVAAARALMDLRHERERLAIAGVRTVAARAVFDRLGYSEADIQHLAVHLYQLAWVKDHGLIGW